MAAFLLASSPGLDRHQQEQHGLPWRGAGCWVGSASPLFLLYLWFSLNSRFVYFTFKTLLREVYKGSFLPWRENKETSC